MTHQVLHGGTTHVVSADVRGLQSLCKRGRARGRYPISCMTLFQVPVGDNAFATTRPAPQQHGSSAIRNGSRRCCHATISIRISRHGRALQLSSADGSVVSAGCPCASCKLCSCCRFATAHGRIALRVCCQGPALFVDTAAHAHGARMVATMSTSGSSGVRIPAELILTATGRAETCRSSRRAGRGLVFRT